MPAARSRPRPRTWPISARCCANPARSPRRFVFGFSPGPARAYARGVRIYAVSNIKGGVGKTTTAVNLAYLSAAAGAATLLWDLDSQGGATYALCGEAHEHASAKK